MEKTFINNNIGWKCKNFQILKFNSEESKQSGIPDSIESHPGNLVTLNGMFTLWNLILGSGVTEGFYPFNADNLKVGIGSGTTPATSSDVSLGSALAFSKADSTEVKIDKDNDKALIQIQSSFGADVANGSWNEWGIFNGDPLNPDSGRTAPTGTDQTPGTDYNIVMLNHKVEPMGTKQQGASWTVIITIELSNQN